MSKLFSWKARILGRKTPEPDRSNCIKLANDGTENVERCVSPRVRFEEPPAEEVAWTNDFPGGPPRMALRSTASLGRNEPPQASSPPDREGFRSPTGGNDYGTVPQPQYRFAGQPQNIARELGTIQEIEHSPPRNGVKAPPVHKEDLDQRAADWEYAGDVRVTIAPMASCEIDNESSRQTRASTVLQKMREQKEQIGINEARRANTGIPAPVAPLYPPTRNDFIQNSHSLGPPQRNLPNRVVSPVNSQIPYRPNGVGLMPSRRELLESHIIFLQVNDEVKRAQVPPRIDTMEQLRAAFVRSFPHISRSYVEQPYVKIYIQDQSKGLFYELEVLNDVKNKCLLRLREQHASGLASPCRALDAPDYLSETEFDDGRHRFVSLARPASAMAFEHRGHGRFESSMYDPYASDASESRSNSVIRSGSATPIIDREARERMENMERQLAGLSSLVHTALTSKGMSETAQRDMASLRREILSLHPDTPTKEMSEEPSSLPDSISSHTQQELHSLRQKISQAGNDCRQLRRTAQVNAQQSRTILREAEDEITRIVREKLGKNGVTQEEKPTNSVEPKRREHDNKMQQLLKNLTTFEQNVESVRNSVLNANRKLRMSEVEQLTGELTTIGRTAAAIKTDFPTIQSEVEKRIKEDMERIIREEKYIKDETAAVDQSLRRCKALANIMVTMKKLAMVQDPSLHRSSSRATSKQDLSNASTLPPPGNTHSQAPPLPPTMSEPVPPPPVPPAPHGYSRQEPQRSNNLDNVLEEVNSHVPPPVPQPPNSGPPVGPPGPIGQPPRPPSRTAVSDVRAKFRQPPELPEEIRSLMEDVRKGSPLPDSQSTPTSERRGKLEERQKELEEKQKQLRSQFNNMKPFG